VPSKILLPTTRSHELWYTEDVDQFRNVIVSPNLAQGQTLLSQSTYNFMVGGWKCGKTSWGPVWSFDQMARFDGEDFLVTAPTYSALNDIIVPLMTVFANATRFKGEFRKNDMCYYTPYGTIFFKSAQDPEHIQGRHVCGGWADEIGQYSHLAWKHIKSRIDIAGGRLLGTTTPYGENWMFTDPYQKWKDGLSQYMFWRLLSIDNPSYDMEVWVRDLLDMPKDEFLMYHMGMFRRRVGLVYPDFSMEYHVTDVELNSKFPCVAGMDFGWGDNTVFKVGQHIPGVGSDDLDGKWLFPEEYVESNATIQDHAKAIAPIIERYEIARVFYDYHGAQTAADLAEELETKHRLRIDFVPVVEPIKVGWEKMTRLIRHNAVLEDRRNTDSLDEYASYAMDKKGQPESREHNHCMDATRYMVTGEEGFEDVVEKIGRNFQRHQMTEAERHIHEVAGDLEEFGEVGEIDSLGAF
jgi:hypothetical protein